MPRDFKDCRRYQGLTGRLQLWREALAALVRRDRREDTDVSVEQQMTVEQQLMAQLPNDRIPVNMFQVYDRVAADPERFLEAYRQLRDQHEIFKPRPWHIARHVTRNHGGTVEKTCVTCGERQAIVARVPWGKDECEQCREETGDCKRCGANRNDCCC